MGHPPRYGRPSDETGRGLAVIVLLAVGLVIGAVVTMVTVLDPPAPVRSASATGGAAHSEEEVRRNVQPILDAYASGSYGDFWDLWSAGAKDLIEREDYIRLFRLCPPLTDDASPGDPSSSGTSSTGSSSTGPPSGAAFTIGSVEVRGDDATVRAVRSGTTTGFGFRFEEGSWRYAPSPQEREEYRTKTADQIARERQGAGLCGAAVPEPADPASPADPSSGPAPDSSPAPADPSTGPSTDPGYPSSGPPANGSSSNAPSSDPGGPSSGPSSDPAGPPSGPSSNNGPSSNGEPSSDGGPSSDPSAPPSDPTSAPPAQES
ncbi:hypothetical protein ACFYSC_34670 [Streptosporangium sp. NPDC004379]|uniref:hypothetical protein n=1 Tax=Streptosporangium sp. NPDC004379 TaxID=3366189 RepID=UPI0036CABF64